MAIVATTTAAPRRALTTTQRFTALAGALPAGVTTTRGEALIGQATGLIEDYCGRVFARERVTEAVYGAQLTCLVLERTPILTVHSIRIEGTLVEADRYEIENAGAGLVRFRMPGRYAMLADLEADEAGYAQRREAMREVRYEIDYTGGWVAHGWPVTDPVTPVTLPIGLEMACIEAVQNLTNGAGAAAGVQSEKLGDASWTYKADAGHGLGGQVRDMLAPYRRVTL